MNKQHPSRLRFNFGFFLEAPLGSSRTYELDYPEVQVEELTVKPLNGSFTAVRTSEGIYLSGQLSTNLEINCVRCLKDATITLILNLDDLCYYPPSQAPEGEYVLSEEGEFDLVPLVRELIVLENPLHPVCQPDCQGLCAKCGQDLNQQQCACEIDEIDPRMAILQQLLN